MFLKSILNRLQRGLQYYKITPPGTNRANGDPTATRLCKQTHLMPCFSSQYLFDFCIHSIIHRVAAFQRSHLLQKKDFRPKPETSLTPAVYVVCLEHYIAIAICVLAVLEVVLQLKQFLSKSNVRKRKKSVFSFTASISDQITRRRSGDFSMRVRPKKGSRLRRKPGVTTGFLPHSGAGVRCAFL